MSNFCLSFVSEISRNRYNRRPARCDRPLGEATLLSLPALAKPLSEAARVPLPRWGEASRRATPTGGPRSCATAWRAVLLPLLKISARDQNLIGTVVCADEHSLIVFHPKRKVRLALYRDVLAVFGQNFANQPTAPCGRGNFSFQSNCASASRIVLNRPFHAKLRWW